MKQFDLFLKLLTQLRLAHPHVTANQVQMFLVIANNPGITSTGIAKALSLPGEKFQTVASVARGLDVLGKGRQQYDKNNNEANYTSMGLLKWTTDMGWQAQWLLVEPGWRGSPGEGLRPEKLRRSSTRFEMPAPLAA